MAGSAEGSGRAALAARAEEIREAAEGEREGGGADGGQSAPPRLRSAVVTAARGTNGKVSGRGRGAAPPAARRYRVALPTRSHGPARPGLPRDGGPHASPRPGPARRGKRLRGEERAALGRRRYGWGPRSRQVPGGCAARPAALSPVRSSCPRMASAWEVPQRGWPGRLRCLKSVTGSAGSGLWSTRTEPM